MSRLAPLAALLIVGSVVLFGCAQGVERTVPATPPSGTSPSKTGQGPGPTDRLGQAGWATLDPLPLAADSLQLLQDTTDAFGAAEVDPGILMYTEPPPGTTTPVYTPSDSVDPAMIRRLSPEQTQRSRPR